MNTFTDAQVENPQDAWTALRKLAACANRAAEIGSDALCIDIVTVIYDLYDERSLPATA